MKEVPDMHIKSRGSLFFEMMKVQNAIKQRDGVVLKSYYENYLSQLTVPSREVYHMGCYSVYSEKISFHLLSIYLLLDLIDFYWDGRKFTNNGVESAPGLLKILSINETKTFGDTEPIRRSVYTMQKITKHKLHVFLLPLAFKEGYSLEITYPGNALILFPQDEMESSISTFNNKVSPQALAGLHHGVGEFYLKKELRDSLPNWADSPEEFRIEFAKWCQNIPAKFVAKKMNEA